MGTLRRQTETTATMGDQRDPHRARRRGALSWALASAAPPADWLMWASWNQGTDDAITVGWFLTWGLAVLAVGCLSTGRVSQLVGLAVVSVVSGGTTLYLWWSATDTSGLFLVGLMLALPVLALTIPLLLLLGSALDGAVRRRP